MAPRDGEYWEGPNQVVGAVKFAVAPVTGATPDMSEKGKVTL